MTSDSGFIASGVSYVTRDGLFDDRPQSRISPFPPNPERLASLRQDNLKIEIGHQRTAR
jgi:hypothetical protein